MGVLKEEDKQRHVMTKVETGMKILPAQERQGPPATPGVGETRDRRPQRLHEEPALLTPRFQTSGLQIRDTHRPFIWDSTPLAAPPTGRPWEVGSPRGPGTKCTVAL